MGKPVSFWQGVEDLTDDLPVFDHVRGFEQTLSQLVMIVKEIDEKTPIFFQTEHGISAATEFP